MAWPPWPVHRSAWKGNSLLKTGSSREHENRIGASMASRPAQEVTRRHDGHQGPLVRTATRRPLAGGLGSGRPLLPPPGSGVGPFVREGSGRSALRQGQQAFRGPGRLLKAPTRHVLRGPEEREAAHAGGRRSPLGEVVPGLRPVRAFARPLQPHPHQGTVRPFGLPPLLSRGSSRSASTRGWCGARSSSSTPPRWRPTPPSTRRGRAPSSGVVWRSTWRRPSPVRPSPSGKKTPPESSLVSWGRKATKGGRSRERTRSGIAGSPGPVARSGPWRGGVTRVWRT